MTETHFGLFRHGQTDWNINFLLQGTTDIPMNSTGIEQVRVAARALRREDWDLILTSPLSRARDSAAIIAETLGVDSVSEEPLLLERSFGEAEGFSHDQWREKFASLDEIPGGESKAQLAERSQLLLSKVANDFAGLRILAVSHGALIRSLIAIASLEQLPRQGERLANASLNIVTHYQANWRVARYELESLRPAD